MEAVELLGREGASIRIADFAAFAQLGPDSFAVGRGGTSPGADGVDGYWREVVSLGYQNFAALRFNPFRVLPRAFTSESDKPGAPLRRPVLPLPASAADDLLGLRELKLQTRADRRPGEIEVLVAAVLEADHTLVMGSDWSYGELELLLLLFPPRLRPALTFHTHALATPPEPLPRVVFTPLRDESAFDTASGRWGHRLPHTWSEIGRHAQEMAADLVGLLDVPERLLEAHDAYERYVEKFEPPAAPLVAEVDTLLRFARMSAVRAEGEPGAALRILAQAAAGNGAPAAAEAELECLLEVLSDGFSAESIGAAIAELIRHRKVDPSIPALVMERFLMRRDVDPESMRAFARPLGSLAPAHALPKDDPAARRILAMLLLLAAAEEDVGAVVAAAAEAAPDPDIIRRLGGPEAWARPGSPVLAELLRGICVEDGGASIRVLNALADLRADLAPGRPQRKLVDAGVTWLRQRWQALPADRWEEALPAAQAVLRLANVVTASGHSLDGRSSADLFKDMLDRSASGARPMAWDTHADAELFLGFLGSEASRSRLAGWEIVERGDGLANELFRRINEQRRHGDAGNEGVHWSLALLDRVHRQELDGFHTPLAVRVLELAAGPRAPELLRAFDQHNSALDAATAGEPQPEPAAAEPHLDDLVENAETDEDTDVLRQITVERGSVRPANWRLPPIPRRTRTIALMAAAFAGTVIGVGALVSRVTEPSGVSAATAAAEPAAVSAPAAAPAPISELANTLAEARLRAANGELEGVVALLSTRLPAASAREAFAWDSLLAASALQHAESMVGNAASRAALLRTAYDRANRALSVIQPFGPGADAMRLTRACACIHGGLACASSDVAEDLVLAARSPSVTVSARAAELLASLEQ